MKIQKKRHQVDPEEPKKKKVAVIQGKVPGARGWRGGGGAALVPTVREYR